MTTNTRGTTSRRAAGPLPAARLITVCLGVLLGGCSLPLSTYPTTTGPARIPDCHASSAGPVLDGIAAVPPGLVAILAGAVGMDCASRNHSGCDGGGLAGFGLTFGLISAAFIASAVHGVHANDACRRAWAAHEDYLRHPPQRETEPRRPRPEVTARPEPPPVAHVPATPPRLGL